MVDAGPEPMYEDKKRVTPPPPTPAWAFCLPSLIGSIVWIISCKTPCLKWFVPECNIGILQLRLGFCNKRQKNGLLS